MTIKDDEAFEGYLSAMKKKGAEVVPEMREITMKDIDDIVEQMIKNPPTMYMEPIHLSVRTKVLLKIFDDYCKIQKQYRIFDTGTKQDRDWFWITPFNKGSLWKIKATIECYYVYYGTFQKLYATTLKDCINYILKQQPQYENNKSDINRG